MILEAASTKCVEDQCGYNVLGEGIGGSLGVIRDHMSDVVLAGAGRIAVVGDALCAEAHACLAAL